ncbi:MAG: twin-arginine translocation pathway signal [Bacteroidetes bacterium OLB12]|nr:MAG: twin-arginine translocation pathway signal [Bacteroidetes bacterium OLB12]
MFLVKLGGFDTHAEQVESYDPTMGQHAALMYHIASAMKAFQNDLKARGLEDRVLTVTTSEFGRRVRANGSYGTDHGTGAPVMIFGKGVQPGVVGKVPNMSLENVEMQYDYRQIYANLLRDWMLVDENKINNDIFFKDFLNGPKEEGAGNYEPLPLAQQVISGVNDNFISSRFNLENCYPNPAREHTTIRFTINATQMVSLSLKDLQGRTIKSVLAEEKPEGTHEVVINVTSLPPGTYFYQLKTGFLQETKKLIVIR